MTARFAALYHVRGDAASIDARAQAIAVEQSVEMPLAAIDDPHVLSDIVGRVDDIADIGGGSFAVRIGLATATVGLDAAQLFNMLFGNTSLHDDVTLHDVEIPRELAAAFGGPRHGIAGLRRHAIGRALTCSALKPQGVAPERLGELAARFAAGGVDFVKDDHGLADQAFSTFAERVPACAAAVRATGTATRYVPSLSGDLNRMRAQIALARDVGLDTVMIAPMLAGPSNMQALVREFPEFAFFAHPAMAGAASIAPPLLAKLFRLLGADAVIFPTHGGRFGYSPEICRQLATTARSPLPGLQPSLPAPAGGITMRRVPELLDFYGPDTMLLIGGSLLAAREKLSEQAAEFARTVARHVYR